MEEQSAPALSNVPVAGSALLSAGQLLASPSGTFTNQTVILGATHTSSPIITGSSYNINIGSYNIDTGSYNIELPSTLPNI